MSKIHYAGCDQATENNINTYWDEYTACGLNTDHHEELALINDERYVTCKNCLKQIDRAKASAHHQAEGKPGKEVGDE